MFLFSAASVFYQHLTCWYEWKHWCLWCDWVLSSMSRTCSDVYGWGSGNELRGSVLKGHWRSARKDNFIPITIIVTSVFLFWLSGLWYNFCWIPAILIHGITIVEIHQTIVLLWPKPNAFVLCGSFGSVFTQEWHSLASSAKFFLQCIASYPPTLFCIHIQNTSFKLWM